MSLGWCAESGLLPRKRRYINGISSATMVGLRAQMAKARQNCSQQHLKTSKGTIGKGINQIIKNKGVDDRNARDEEDVRRSVDVTGRLQDKASLYAQFAREGDRDGSEGLIDFERKAMLDEKRWGPRAPETAADEAEYDAAGRRRRAWHTCLLEEELEEERRARVRRLLQEVCDETSRARERVLRMREQKRKRELRRLAMMKERKKLKLEGLKQTQQEDLLEKLYEAIQTQQDSEEESGEDEGLPSALAFVSGILSAAPIISSTAQEGDVPPPPPSLPPPPPPDD